ncbi:MAG: sodium:calcium antiporter [Maritimibacter sp.]
MDFFYAILGLLILLLAGDSLVRGAVNLSLRIGVPALVVSLTVVAFGTSAPELLISVQSVLDHAPRLAAATALFMLLATTREFGWIQGIVLLSGLGLMLTSAYQEATQHRREKVLACEAELAAKTDSADIELMSAQAECAAEAEDEEELEGLDPDMPWGKVILFLVLGLIGLPFGANILVEASVHIARSYGVSETVIGLTLVAMGTSLPELATTVMAAYRNQADVALGNVIGSNMFNLLAIIGVASMVGPIPVDPEVLHVDLWVMCASSLLIAPFVFRGWHLGRRWGIFFTGLYIAYILMLLGK